jgi:CRP/FNR family transcriptional regulator, polysaccharide utilization system transcription regulator
MEEINQTCSNCKTLKKSIFRDMENGKSFPRKIVNFEKGDFLFHEKGSSDGVFCLKSGQVEQLKKDNSHQDRLINMATPGEMLGVSSVLLSPSIYSASAMAVKPSEACFIEKKTILNILHKNPKTAMNLMKMLSGKVKELEPLHV